MDKVSAGNLVKETLQNPFDKGRFTYFIKNLLNEIDETKAFHVRGQVHEKYRDRVKTYERIGTYTDPENKKIDVLVVYLQKEGSIDRARTTLRNFAGDYLKERGEKEAGLIAFVSPNPEDWRFSLVKMEYKITETPGGRVRAEEEFTPAKRYSFLVGEHETTHTAKSRLVPILEDNEHNPTLKHLEDAFNIEKVTKEFFEKYRDLFLWLKESLDKLVKEDAKIKADFQAKEVNTVDFAKKLLGQIVFLYFLQKKGWFGVARGKEWGSGSKQFLRELFKKKHGDYKNFFNDILEPLFYEALRLERSGDYYSRFNCRIPFLNGGLFDPLNDYDWWDTDILLSDDIFSNDRKTKEGDTGDGILDIFDRYNFTVKEDEPLEKEVAIDPEMLGKVFENLLEVKDRKSKGTYYTPREIVHYMCQESLINYLATELEGKVNKEGIETLIKYGETVVEHEAEVENRGEETETYSYKLPKSVRDNSNLIDEKLETIRICDPAVGSGAFPVGMMNEIIRTRNALTPYIKDGDRTPYHFKREAIQNCLYGVDIDPGAVEIAKLRLWLSLVVEEAERETIQPLPNLDYKIMQGNSLLGVEKEKMGMRDMFFEDKMKDLKAKKQIYFSETSASKKQDYKKQIDELISQITNGHRDFNFEVYFSEIFQEKGGFDVVIANPPYFQLQKNKKVSQELSVLGYKTYSKSSDIYCIFYEKGINILRKGGLLSYISSNSWMKTKYGSLLRRYIVENTNPLSLINFENSQLFETAIVETSVIILEKGPFQNKLKALTFNLSPNEYENIGDHFTKKHVVIGNLDDSGWVISSPEASLIRAKLEKNSLPLKQLNQRIYIGVLNGYNDAFVISSDTKDQLIKEDPKSAEIIKPMLRGRDVGKYHYSWQKLWLINSHNGIKGRLQRINVEKDYTAIYRHLVKFRNKLEIRRNKGSHWSNLRNCAYFEEFEKPKIIWGELSDKPKFAYDDKGFFPEATLFAMVGDNLKYLLGILNSKLGLWYFEQISTSSGMGTSRWKKYKIELFPIKNTDKISTGKIVAVVDGVLAITKDEDYLQNPTQQAKVREYEKQIDQLVYKLYGLTPEEIKIVENSGR